MATTAATVPNPTSERNKMILAIVLGTIALIALFFAFIKPMMWSSTSAAKATPTPKPSPTPSGNRNFNLPTAEEQNFTNVTTPIVYSPGSAGAPDPGRNIFAFKEPDPPCPIEICPPPTPTPFVAPTPSPTPKPFYTLAFVNPQSIYAGQSGFRIELNGEAFDPQSQIYFNQTPLPTTFVSPQKIVADVPSNLVAQEGSRQVIVQSPDGRKYSEQFMFTVQAPPRPAFQYIGMIGRKRYNNDTGYFMESGKNVPFGARLNDVVAGRFRLIKLTPGIATFEDTSLGFKHQVPITQAASGAAGPAGMPPRGTNPTDPGFQVPPFNPQPLDPNNCPPGIPCGNLRPSVPNPNQLRPGDRTDKKDVDDNDDGDN